jgi:hypothetical protein
MKKTILLVLALVLFASVVVTPAEAKRPDPPRPPVALQPDCEIVWHYLTICDGGKCSTVPWYATCKPPVEQIQPKPVKPPVTLPGPRPIKRR